MRAKGHGVELSASDLSYFLGCRHRSALDLSVAKGLRVAPSWIDPALAVLQERGMEHERQHVQRLRGEGLGVVDCSEGSIDEAVARTEAAMREGADVVVQAAARHGCWFGRPDVLRRVESASLLGPWSYEVFDTKLARETKGTTILQLSLYSDLVGRIQGGAPEFFHVITPDSARPVKTYRVLDYAAYFRRVQRGLEEFIENDVRALETAHYPEPVELCSVCRWWKQCDARRRTDDHLSLVAGISRLQITELRRVETNTLTELAQTPLPIPFKPARGSAESLVRVREQARMQLGTRARGVAGFEMLPPDPERGLSRLPEPSPGDIFLDLEGDPFAREGGREFLFGWAVRDAGGELRYRRRWAYSDTDERSVFESLVDAIADAWARDPKMHVYHYAPYETAAVKRLMGRYATRESQVDRMLRGQVFVDLYAVVKHSLRAGIEKYSIKDLEQFFGYVRGVALDDAGASLRVVERALELGITDAITPEVRNAVEGYNRDDCLALVGLQQWLESQRRALVDMGATIQRPVPPELPAEKELTERAMRVRELVATLTAGVPTEAIERTDDENARWVLAHLLEWHRREAKAPWWEFFRLRELSPEELIDERAALSGLQHSARVGGTARSPIDRYTYPSQEAEIAEGDLMHLPDGADFGTVSAIDLVGRTVDIKKRGAHAATHPIAVFAHSIVRTEVLADALYRIACDVADRGIAGNVTHKPARELLLRRRPRLRSGQFRQAGTETEVQFATRIATELENSVLAIQGPPGAGKTFTAAQMICELVSKGKRVGVTAVSHKVIRNLLDAADQAGKERKLDIHCVQKVTDKSGKDSPVAEITDNADVLARLADGRANVVGGTAWLWAREDARNAVDVLFVDEAGQMSLANVLAVSQAAASVVLVGDPRQLEQPQQGSHPDGTNVSALEHLLDGRQTIPPDRGIFLPETWRLAPRICEFTSEMFYENRLRARAGLENQTLANAGPMDGSGLRLVLVPHNGNQSSSVEEVAVVHALVSALLRDASWTDRDGTLRRVTPTDVLVVAPYNAQVALLSDALSPFGIRVGTVDRFQGQEAPVVVYSVATSSPEDAPHGMEFLYSPNRLNVATSRAKCVCVIVAAPRIFEPECKTPRHMQLANAYCRYLELARESGHAAIR